MEVIHPCCAGIDVHKDTAVTCIRQTHGDGQVDEQVRTFQTTTAGLLELGDWLVGRQVPLAAMESTGVYWKPVWNLLESRLDVMLVNSRDTKQRLAARPMSGTVGGLPNCWPAGYSSAALCRRCRSGNCGI